MALGELVKILGRTEYPQTAEMTDLLLSKGKYPSRYVSDACWFFEKRRSSEVPCCILRAYGRLEAAEKTL